MAYTNSDDVLAHFQGIDFDSGFVSDSIDEASRVVAQYELMTYGRTDQASDTKVVDYGTNFEDEGIEVDAKVWKLNSELNKKIVDGEQSLGTVDAVNTHELEFTEESGDMSFLIGSPYMVEDIARRSKAEEYKSAALLVGQMASSNAEVMQGAESVSVGEIEVEFGDIEEVANAVDKNQFEKKFYTIVGDYYA